MPRSAVARGCIVDGCARPGGRHGLFCRLHYDRQRRGIPLDAPLNVRTVAVDELGRFAVAGERRTVESTRHGGRTHREALRELAVRLEALRVVQDPAQAREFVVLLATHWPSSDLFRDDRWVDVLGDVGDRSLFGL